MWRRFLAMIKLCLFCEHCYLHMPTSGYSEYTPGTDWFMLCNKNVWNFDPCDSSEEEYFKIITTAKVCPEFRVKKWLEQYVKD